MLDGSRQHYDTSNILKPGAPPALVRRGFGKDYEGTYGTVAKPTSNILSNAIKANPRGPFRTETVTKPSNLGIPVNHYGDHYGSLPPPSVATQPLPSVPLPVQSSPMIFTGDGGGRSADRGGSSSDPLAAMISMFGSMISMLLGGLSVNIPSFNLQLPKLPEFGGINMGNVNLSHKYQLEANQKSALDSIMPQVDGICRRDYSDICPVGWRVTSNGLCQAPLEYTGSCSHQLSTEDMTSQQKSALANQCKIVWACVNTDCMERDYSAFCPEGWKINEHTCMAPSHYQGTCKKELDFVGFSLEEKKQYEDLCGLKWPCVKRHCVQDFSQICPDKWFYDVELRLCMASDLSKGGCLESPAGIAEFSVAGKEAFAASCGVSYPCKSVKTMEQLCEVVDYSQPCPVQWENKWNTGACVAPSTFKSATAECRSLLHFSSADEKKKFSKKCGAQWPCNSKSFYDSPCPSFFELVDDVAQLCAPTSDYQGACKEPISFLGKSPEYKETFETTCDAHWERSNVKPINPINPRHNSLAHGFFVES